MNHNATPKLNDSHATRSIAWLALLCTLILLPRDLITPADAGDRSSGRFYMTGQMWTRNLVRGPQGQPIFAEFAADGTPIKEIGEAINEPLKHASVMSANDYRLEVARYDDLKARFNTTDAKGHAILNRDAYSASAFKTLREGYTINRPTLQPSTRSVVVRGALTLLTVGTQPVLLESTINLNSIDREVISNTNLKSLLIDAKGNVLYKTQNNYGYRVSDIKQESGESDPLCRPAYGIETDRDGYKPTQDALCGPVLGAHVETQIFPGQYGGTLTGSQGRWAITYFKSPCPGFDYRYTTDFYQTLFYTNFNPKGSALGQYFQRDEWADWCMGLSEALAGSTSLSGLMTSMAMSAIENSTAEGSRHMINYVDVAAITGLAKFGNGLNPLDAIPGDSTETQYKADLPTFTTLPIKNDLNFDVNNDKIPDPYEVKDYDNSGTPKLGFYLNGHKPGDRNALGSLIPPDVVKPLSEFQKTITVRPVTSAIDFDADGVSEFDFDGDGLPDPTDVKDYNNDGSNEVGFYLNGRKPEDKDANGIPLQPDLIRRLDTLPDYQHQGLLKKISQQDMKETDLYIYRVSNGQKIQERRGLNDVNIYKDGTSNVSYLSLLRGPRALSQFFGLNFSDWQSATGINPELHVKQADHLRVGEPLKIILVNRRTGYIGTTLTQMPAATSGSIDFPIAPIVMRPPNLKIKAQRQYDVQAGLTKDKDPARNYLIGFEGASLASDSYIQVTTDWFDHDGTPLPGDLHGYTGRMARITSDKTLDSNAVAQFPIHPGSHQQLVRLSQQDLGTEHYYIHVSGEPADGSPDFTTLGSQAEHEVLKKRPRHYVPVQVPVYDEAETARRKNEQLYALQSGDLTPAQKTKIEPVHRWVYRPEMQFSVLDLDVKNIYRTDADNNVLDILPPGKDSDTNTIPGLATGDSLVKILFDLNVNKNDPLDPFGYINPDIKTSDPANTTGHDFVFQLGQDEAIATVGTNQTVQFYNLNHLAALTPEDYLTINLLQNTDAGNILWEFAFETLDLIPPRRAGEIEISADDNTTVLNVLLPGFVGRDDSQKQNYTLMWRANAGTFAPPLETNKEGSFAATLTLPKVAGTTVVAQARLGNAEPTVNAVSAAYKVVPGKPHTLIFEQTGKAGIAGIGQIDAKVRVFDQWLNKVVDGTTIEVTPSSDLSIASDFTVKDGVVDLIIKGVETAGTNTLTIKAQTAELTATVNIDDITLSISMPSSVPVDTIANIDLSASCAAGVVDGIPAILRNSFGELEHQTVVFSGGQAHTRLYGGLFKGAGVFSAQITSVVKTHNYAVVQPSGGEEPTLGVNALIADQTTNGTFTVTNDAGVPQTFSYAAQTALTVKGAPGATVPVTLGTLAAPVIEPVLELPMYSIGPNNTVFDRYDVIHGIAGDITASNESAQGFRGSYSFVNDAAKHAIVRIPNHTALDKGNDTGFSLNFKPASFGGALVNGDLRTQSLTLTTDGKVQYQIQTSDGTFTTTSAPIALNQWHTVAAHYKAGQMLLEVDGQLSTTPATGAITHATALAAMRLGQDYNGQMNEFRVIDWTLPTLITFADGSTQTNATIGTGGTAQLTIKSTGQMGYRNIAINKEDGFNVANFFIPRAYAEPSATTPGFFAQITAGAQQVGMGLVTAATAVVQTQINIGNGLLFGDTSTTEGAVADFIVGFVPFVGSGRDIALQKYYGWSGNEKYDELTLLLGYIGLAADSAAALGTAAAVGTGGVATPIAGIAVSFKIAAATFRGVTKFIPRNSAFRGVLVHILRDALVAVKQGNWNRIATTLNVIQLVIVAVEIADLREVMLEAIQTEEDFDTWRDYADQYNGDSASASLDQRLMDFFMRSAYAGSATGLTNILKQVVTYAREAKLVRIGVSLTQSLKVLTKLDDTNELKSYRFTLKGIRVLMKVHDLAGKEGLDAVVKYGKPLPAGGGLDTVRTFEGLMDDIDKIKPMDKFRNLLAGEKGLKDVFTNKGNGLACEFSPHIRTGAAHHIHMIAEYADETATIQLRTNVVGANNKGIGEIFPDQITATGKIRDAKAWIPTRENMVKHFKDDIEFSKKLDPSDLQDMLPGQIYKYIVLLHRGTPVELVFDKRALGQEGMIKDALMDVLKNVNPNTRNRFIEDLGWPVPDGNVAKAWDEFLKKFKGNNLDGFVQVLQ